MPKVFGRILRRPLFCVSLYSLAACTGFNSAAVQGVRLAVSGLPQQNVAAATLSSKYIYLETHAPNAQSLMVLAYEDKPQGQPPIDTWVSGQGEAMRTQAGLLSSAGGMPGFWENVQYAFNSEGQPTVVQFDLPKYSLYGVRMQFSNLGPVQGKFTALMQRAAALPSVQFQVYQAHWVNPPPHPPADLQLNTLNFAVGINSSNGVPVYGLSCLQTNYCVEYLLRTAAQNL